MTLLEMIEFLAPGLVATPLPDRLLALEIAAAFRPQCLPLEQQDLAQIYYAIYLLYDRKRQLEEQMSGVISSAPPGVKSITEGDVRVEWDGSQRAAWNNGIFDPSGYLARWNALNNLCGFGAIIASDWWWWRDECR